MPGDQEAYKQAMNRGHSSAWDLEWGNAAAYYRQALEEFPGSTQAQISLAAAYFELGDFEKSLEQYRAVVENTPNDILVLEKIAQIFEILGQTSRDRIRSATGTISSPRTTFPRRHAAVAAVMRWPNRRRRHRPRSRPSATSRPRSTPPRP